MKLYCPKVHHLLLLPAAVLENISPHCGVEPCRHVRVEDGPSLREALDEALARPGATLVEAVVDPHGAARQDARVRAEIERGLEEALR